MIELESVSKRFRLYNAPVHRIAEWISRRRLHQEFYAVRDVTLHVPDGRTMGLIGGNGAGKSTLLKMIAGTLLPSTGQIKVRGRIAALLELGTGFHPDFTGRQNIYINGQLLGLTEQDLQGLEQEIIEFSELGSFIDQPIRTYSSGMVVRLGFSIAASVNPDVLIIDEALSVGDARFSQKCIRKIQQFREEKKTILFVSHDPGAVMSLCDEAVLLEQGSLTTRGTPRDVLDEYNARLAAMGQGNVSMRISRSSQDGQTLNRHGTFEAIISDLTLLNASGVPSDTYTPGEEMTISLTIVFLSPVNQPSIGVLIKDRLGLHLYGTNTTLQNIKLPPCKPGDAQQVEFTIPLNIGYGTYSLTVAVHDDETHLEACYEWTENAAFFHIRHQDKPNWTGVLKLPVSITHKESTVQSSQIAESLKERFEDLPTQILPGTTPISPFVYGFREVQTIRNTRGIFCAGEGSFVYHHPARYTIIKIVSGPQKENKPAELHFTRPVENGASRMDFSPAGEQFSVVLELNQNETNQFHLWHVVSHCASAPVPFHIVSIDSMEELKEDPQWPITTQVR